MARQGCPTVGEEANPHEEGGPRAGRGSGRETGVIGGDIGDVLIGQRLRLGGHHRRHAATALTGPVGLEGALQVGGVLAGQVRIDRGGALAVGAVTGGAGGDLAFPGGGVAGSLGVQGQEGAAQQGYSEE